MDKESANDPGISRADTVRAVTESVLDLLVVGGGIVGAGVARDAAMRGLRVGLVEQFDFASGASGRTSRLLHGGLRYLARGRLGQVRAASREKRVLAGIAPHLVQPMAFLFPAYAGARPRRWELAAGVKLYDLLCGGRNFEPSRSMGAEAFVSRAGGIRREGLLGGVRYFDALTCDARLVVDTLRSACRAGAMALNYFAAKKTERMGDEWIVEAKDGLTGDVVELRARVVVNATGVWGDRFPESRLALRPTKGAHVVVDRERFAAGGDEPREAVVLTEGARVLFAIPWGRRVILGTTDTDYSGPLDDVRCEAEDADCILAAVNRLFPDVALTMEDVRSRWAGLRPLIADGGVRPADASRAHEIIVNPSGWIDVAGGKLTTYRLMAQQTTDRVFRCLGRRSPACRTAREPLLEAAGSGVIPPHPSDALVWHYCEHEWAHRVSDVMLRRGGWTHYVDEPDVLARRVARWMAEVYHWDAAKEASEIENYKREANGPARGEREP